jgi:hypothetical protein
MEYNNYTNLGITSAKKPASNHLIVEMANGDLIMVDSTSTTDLIISDDKGANWDSVDTGDFTSGVLSRTNPIKAMWHDRGTTRLYYATLEAGADWEARVFYLDSGYNETQVGGAVTDDCDSVDVFIMNSVLSIMKEDRGGGPMIYEWVDPNWVQADVLAADDLTDQSYMVVIDATNAYFYGDETVKELTMYHWSNAAITAKDEIAGYGLPADSQKAIAYDGNNLLYFIATKDADGNADYLMSYSISGDVIAEVCKLDINIMLDRNTASTVNAKAFHSSNYEVYQLHPVINYRFYLIATPALSGAIVAITDNFLIASDGGATWEVWELEDVSGNVMSCIINHSYMNHPSATISLTNTYPLSKGYFIIIKDMYTSAGSSASANIFEGFVTEFSDRNIQDAILISPAKRDLDEEFPVGDYSGRTDEIIVDFIGEYCNYITEGTLSNGTAMGTITFAGDKSIREIIDEFSLTDKFIWYLTPSGAFYYNTGAVDTVENLTAASNISDVGKAYGTRAINYVNIKGGFVSGSQVSGTVAEDIPDQQKVGRIPFERTFSHLDLAAQCTTTNTNVLSRYGKQPLIVKFIHQDSTVGFMQPGETITFEYSVTDPAISSDQFGIKTVKYNALNGTGHYTITDEVL